ncbi:helix-turn-helix domain-containing protein [Gluconacetobacter diazotrophicus]|uniref:Helix-turn-helix domain-containing protein n=1 Tax=Gluconacetobacter diazotrophicus TaxID=33996 RepID=A0A7W4NGC1_GLUDI|nr:helix-turn-helix domain-containing protein [Gluconacetobacter diazotrophicus]
MNSLPPKLFRVADVANRWSCSNQTIHNLIRRGDLPAIRIGALYRLRPDDVLAYENRACPDPNQPPQNTASPTVMVFSTSSGGTERSRSAFHLGQKIGMKQRAP